MLFSFNFVMPFAIQKQLNCYFVLYGLIFVITLRLKSSLIVIMYYFGINFVMSFATQKQLNCYPVLFGLNFAITLLLKSSLFGLWPSSIDIYVTRLLIGLSSTICPHIIKNDTTYGTAHNINFFGRRGRIATGLFLHVPLAFMGE